MLTRSDVVVAHDDAAGRDMAIVPDRGKRYPRGRAGNAMGDEAAIRSIDLTAVQDRELVRTSEVPP